MVRFKVVLDYVMVRNCTTVREEKGETFMKIGIIGLGYMFFPCEQGPSRFYYLADLFARQGHEVEVISSSFQHYIKKPKDKELILSQNYPFQITFIDVPEYKKNICVKRLYSNSVAEKKVLKHLKENQYDVIYCAVPANNIAASVGKYCKKQGIPLIVDVEDLWPEAMEMVCKIPVVTDILYYPLKRQAETAYACADAVIGTSDEYTNRAFQNQNRNILKKTIYVGCDLDVFDKGAKEHLPAIEKPENEFWVTYAGSIGASYDIRTFVEAGKLIKDRGYDQIRLKILGTGPLHQELEALKEELGCDNIAFLGYTPYTEMAGYLVQSDVTLNSFVKGAAQSIVNKVGDYLAAGKPMINTLESPEFMHLVDEKGFGVNIEPEQAEVLADTIIQYYEGRNMLCLEQGKKARETAEECFDRKRTYQGMVEIAEELVGR